MSFTLTILRFFINPKAWQSLWQEFERTACIKHDIQTEESNGVVTDKKKSKIHSDIIIMHAKTVYNAVVAATAALSTVLTALRHSERSGEVDMLSH